jgi:SAM-dependent methyltransferase
MSLTAEAANPDQAKAWDGEEGKHWSDHEAHYEAAVRRYDPHLLDAADIDRPDHVLDVGCGCGGSTREAARIATSGLSLGVDLSALMIQRARRRARAEGIPNVRFEQADAQIYPFGPRSFDVAISRFGAMFFADPVAAFANIGSALRAAGRLAVLTWQGLRENDWLLAIRQALAAGRTLPAPPTGVPGAFGLADPTAIAALLPKAGFNAVTVQAVREPVWLGHDAQDAFEFMRGMGIVRGLLGDLDNTTAAAALEALRAALRDHETAHGVLLGSAAWIVTARQT